MGISLIQDKHTPQPQKQHAHLPLHPKKTYLLRSLSEVWSEIYSNHTPLPLLSQLTATITSLSISMSLSWLSKRNCDR